MSSSMKGDKMGKNVDKSDASSLPEASAGASPNPSAIPLVFVDGVTTHWHSPSGVVKYYLARSEPDPRAEQPSNDVPVLQIVMPIGGFVSMVAFFNHRLKSMLNAKVVTQEQIDGAQSYWEAGT